jgi:membrane-associated phospholipid phosphatase
LIRFHHFTWRRLLWLVIMLGAMLMYLPINHYQQGGVQLNLALDSQIPLYPPAIIMYLLGSVLFVVFPVLVAIYAKPGDFEAFVIAIIIAAAASCVVYLAYPTYVVRPEVTSNDFFSRAVALLYEADRSYNAAPSGHTFYTLIICFFASRWVEKLSWLWWVIATLIIFSTLFTKQHYVLDLVYGLALAVLAYDAGRLIQKRWNLKFAS